MAATSLLGGGTLTFGGGITSEAVDIAIKHRKHTAAVNRAKSDDIINGLMAQSLTLQTQKSVRPIYELGTTNCYTIDGRSSGSGSIAHVIGGNNANLWSTLRDFADVCKATDVIIYCGPSCGEKGSTGAVTATCGNLTGLSLSVQTADYTVASNLSFIFYDLDYQSV